ncbi:MAG: hypothetical protein IPN04_07025 [Rhodoferax sp.]|nr:hypothetical protein [Rhodoferax sp.]
MRLLAWRYLPTGIDKQAREYVRNAVLHGSSNKVDFTIKGDMSDMPSKNPKQGIFRVEAKSKQCDCRLCTSSTAE